MFHGDIMKQKRIKRKSEKKDVSKRIKPSKKESIILFLLKFCVIFFGLAFLINYVDLSFFNNYAASVSSSLVGLENQGNAVIVDEKVFFVTNNCLGLLTASILAALIFSFNEPDLKKKFVLFALGTAIILVANIFRLSLVLFSATIGFDAELVHTLTWFLMSAIVLVIWYYGSKDYF